MILYQNVFCAGGSWYCHEGVKHLMEMFQVTHVVVSLRIGYRTELEQTLLAAAMILMNSLSRQKQQELRAATMLLF